MDSQIDQVIAELSKIDDAATKVLAGSEAEKEAYAQKINDEIRAFDEEIDQKTKDELAAFEKKLQEERDAELTKWRADTMKTLDEMDQWYENNHEAVAKKVLKDIIKE